MGFADLGPAIRGPPGLQQPPTEALLNSEWLRLFSFKNSPSRVQFPLHCQQVYISEISYPGVRGLLGSCVQLMVVTGILLAYLAGNFHSLSFDPH